MFIQLDLQNIFEDDQTQQTNLKYQSNNEKTRSPLDFFNISQSYQGQDDQDYSYHNQIHTKLNYPFENSHILDSQYSSQENGYQYQLQSTHSTRNIKNQLPGERLYYESKANKLRKLKQQQQMKYELQLQEQKIFTFTPQINKKSIRLLEHRQNQQRQYFEEQKKLKKKKQIEQISKKRAYQQLKECTFKPKIAKKTQILTRNRSDNVFQNLYKQFKLKQIQKQIQSGVQTQQVKQRDKQQSLNNFLQRNQTFLKKHKKKLDMLQQKVQNYDLKTGVKLFTPRIIKPKKQNQISKSLLVQKQSLQNLNLRLQQKMEGMKKKKEGNIKRL